MRREQLRLKVAAGVLTVLLGFLGLADFLPHTDDGCAIEVHCLACRARIIQVADSAIPATTICVAQNVAPREIAGDQRPADPPTRLLPPGRAPPVSA